MYISNTTHTSVIIKSREIDEVYTTPNPDGEINVGLRTANQDYVFLTFDEDLWDRMILEYKNAARKAERDAEEKAETMCTNKPVIGIAGLPKRDSDTDEYERAIAHPEEA
jgi:hypothetical protein